MSCMHADLTEDTELDEEGDEDELAVNSETGELLDTDLECPLHSTAEGEPYCVCPNGVHCTIGYPCPPLLHCEPRTAMPMCKAKPLYARGGLPNEQLCMC